MRFKQIIVPATGIALLAVGIFALINTSTGRSSREIENPLKASARKLAALEVPSETHESNLPQLNIPYLNDINSKARLSINEGPPDYEAKVNPSSPAEEYRVVEKHANGMTLEIKIPEYELNSREIDNEVYRTVSIPGYFPREESGKPILPVKVITVPLPGVESVDVRVLSSLAEEIDAGDLYRSRIHENGRREAQIYWIEGMLADPKLNSSGSTRDAAFTEMLRHMKGGLEEKAVESTQDDISAKEWVYPEEMVIAGAPYWMRERQLVNLMISPGQYSAQSETLTLHSSILIDIHYGPAQPITAKEEFNSYKKQFKLARSDSFKVSVTSDGIHTLTYQNLLDAGFNMSGDPRSLKMYFLGEEISIFIQGEEDGFWDPGDYLDFYGEKNTGFYSQTNIYWLYQDTSRGKRMEELSAPPAGRPAREDDFLDNKHLEEDKTYMSTANVDEGSDYWFWDFAGVGWAKETEFELAGIADGKGQVPFRARFYGITSDPDIDPDHHTRIYLNDYLIGDFFWDGQVDYDFETNISRDYLESVNVLKVEQIGDTGALYDFIYLNSFDVSYRRGYECENDSLAFSASKKGDYLISGFSGEEIALYDITDNNHPKRIIDFGTESGASYSIRFRKNESGSRDYFALRGIISSPGLEENQPSDLGRARRVDYLVITHPDFSASIQPLVDFRDDRENGGLRAEAFEIQEVYDTFSFGNFDPEAILNFLKYTYHFWKQPAPSYVLLVGDGNYDYKDYQGSGEINYIPPYLFQSNFMQTASDNWYVCLVGDDNVPDMNIGRFCVKTAGETNDHVQKIIDYENSTSGLPWQEDILMSADDPDVAAGNFPGDSDWLIDNYIPAPYSADTAYKPDLGSGTRIAVINAINAGRLIVNYLGHGSSSTWSSSPVILKNNDVGLLTNSDRLPLMTTMTCMNGYWCDLGGKCLAEVMTGAVGKGTITNMSPTGMCINSVSKLLVAYLFEELLTDGRKKIGPAITEAKSRLYDVGPYEELDLYHLFGDPALRLK